MKALDWALRILPAAILLQTLYFKFTGAPESVYIFSALGAEPWGRLGSGAVELIAASLLLVSRTAWMGAALAMGVMVGAVLSHLFVLGIAIQGDGGALFGLACVVLITSALTLYRRRAQVFHLRRIFSSSS